MKVNIVNITPVMASEFLSNNGSNRKINKKQLDMIIRTIDEGKWKLTHQGIAFYDDGSLADGQHRLQAIMRTGASLTMPVFTGIKKDSDTIMAIDCGKGRSVIDGSLISGVKIKPSDLTLAKGLHFGYEVFTFPKTTHLESYELCKKYVEEIKLINALFPKNKSLITLAPVKVGILNAMRNQEINYDTVSDFCQALVSGEYSESIFVNAVRLRSKLLSTSYSGSSNRISAYNMAYNTIVKTSKNEVVKRILESKLVN